MRSLGELDDDDRALMIFMLHSDQTNPSTPMLLYSKIDIDPEMEIKLNNL